MAELSLVGKKCGMTRVFTSEGQAVPVTVLEVTPNRVTQVNKKSIQVTTGSRSAKHLTKPLMGHYKKAGVEPGRGLWEFALDEKQIENYKVGMELKVDVFSQGQFIDVAGITKGKGFKGVVARWGFGGGDASHGCSLSHRTPGSIGQRQTPGRVFKNKKMAGHTGATLQTIQSQEIIQIDVEKNLLLVRGAVPGAPGGHVFIKPAVKVKRNKEDKK